MMNTRQMQYAVLLSRVRSFSQLAEKLNITQPALSKQILSLEKELGVQLFDRNQSPLAPTAAGAYFVKQAKKLLYEHEQLTRSMEQFRSGEKGQLVIGSTPFRCTYLLPPIVKKIREQFPGIQVKLVEKSSELLRKDAADGKFDLAVINLPVDETILDATAIEADHLVLVVPESLAQKHPHLQQATADLTKYGDIPFVTVGPGQEMRVLFDKLCLSNNISPEIAAEVVSLTTAWETACGGTGATLLPLQFVKNASEGKHIRIQELKNRISLRQPAVVTKKGQYLSPYAKFAISLLTK